MNKTIGIIGLGRMGSGIALQLAEKGWDVFAYNRTFEKTKDLESFGIKAATSVSDLISSLPSPKVIWVMLPAGEVTDQAIIEASKYMFEDDFIIDAGNSHFANSIFNYKFLKEKKINFLDIGTSGGPGGARYGACLMVGGYKANFDALENLFKDISVENGYQFFEGEGAGHFAKMVHNGIEYGMMQAIAEGFNLLKNSKYKYNLEKLAELFNNGSVIESSLINWLKEGYKKYGDDLKNVTSFVGSSGEVEWLVETAGRLKQDVRIIDESIKFRYESAQNKTYTGKILAMLRNMFGGHEVK